MSRLLRTCLLIALLLPLAGCAKLRERAQQLHEPEFRGQTAEMGSDVRPDSDDDRGLTSPSKRGRQIERNLGL